MEALNKGDASFGVKLSKSVAHIYADTKSSFFTTLDRTNHCCAASTKRFDTLNKQRTL